MPEKMIEPVDKTNALDDEVLTREEMNLVEYPLGFLSRRAPQGVKTIEYHDWVTIDSQRRPVHWIVTGSAKYGLPVGGDQDYLMAIFKVWHDAGFKDRHIPIGSTYKTLDVMNLPKDGRTYRRFRLALDRWVSLYIKSENAFWDRENNRYVATRGFHLFEDYQLIEKFKKNDTTIPLPFGYIKASEELWNSVRNGNLKMTDLKLYSSLDSPVTKRLYRYLDKKKRLTNRFSITVKRLAGKMGLVSTKSPYRPVTLRKLLTPSLEQLIQKGVLSKYEFAKGKEGEKLTTTFEDADKSAKPPLLDINEETERAKYVARSIAGELSDMDNLGFYIHVALRCPYSLMFAALSETRDAANRHQIKTTRARFFNDLIQRLAVEQEIDLKLSSKPSPTSPA